MGTLQLHIAAAKNMAAAKMAAAKAHQLRLDISVVQNFLPGAAEPEGKEIFEIFRRGMARGHWNSFVLVL